MLCRRIRIFFGRFSIQIKTITTATATAKATSAKCTGVSQMSTPNVTLSNGRTIPMIGLGTWRSPPNVVAKAVKDAIDIGYRHFDCAHSYENHAEIGEALEEKMCEGVVQRSDLFVTSKLWNTFHQPDHVKPACETSLKELRLDYLDLYLMHWPMGYKASAELHPKYPDTGKLMFDDIDYIETWHAMEKLVDEGLCKAIGVSNFNQEQLKRLLCFARIKPVMLQIECHPYLSQKELIKICHENSMAVTSYSSLGSAQSPYEKPGAYPLLKNPCILDIAEKYKREPAQILLRYQTQNGVIVIPRSVSKDHMAANFHIWDFDLSDEHLEKISQLDINGRFMTMEPTKDHPHYPF